MGQNIEFNLFATYTDNAQVYLRLGLSEEGPARSTYTDNAQVYLRLGLSEEGPARSTSALRFIVISLNASKGI